MIVFQAHSKPLLALAFSPDGRRLATASKEADVRVWADSFEAPALVCRCRASTWASLAFSPDGRLLGHAGKGGVAVWDLAMPDVPVRAWPQGPRACFFSPDGAVLHVVAHSQPLRRWRKDDWSELPAFGGGRDQDPQGHHRCHLGDAVSNPAGTLIAAAYVVSINPTPPYKADTVIYLWDGATGEVRGELRTPFEDEHPAGYAFSPCGRYLAAAHGRGVRVWDVPTRAEVAYRKAGRRKHTALVFTPDGTRLVTISGGDGVTLWETASWRQVGGFRWDVGNIHCVAASPDGMRMAAGGNTGKVVIWDVE
jgi:WD40 repeat protein